MRPCNGLDPKEYLRCFIRLVPLWPPERMLELSPLLWKRTRERLDSTALAAEFGSLALPAEPLGSLRNLALNNGFKIRLKFVSVV
jgi:hypothetical protein